MHHTCKRAFIDPLAYCTIWLKTTRQLNCKSIHIRYQDIRDDRFDDLTKCCAPTEHMQTVTYTCAIPSPLSPLPWALSQIRKKIQNVGKQFVVYYFGPENIHVWWKFIHVRPQLPSPPPSPIPTSCMHAESVRIHWKASAMINQNMCKTQGIPRWLPLRTFHRLLQTPV